MSGEKFGVPRANERSGQTRGRGRPHKISREQIIGAARGFAPEALTMQAVADVLGVDPTSLNYYVDGREGLRELVAMDVFESELRRITLPAEGDWRDIATLFATALRDAVVMVGALVPYLQPPHAGGWDMLAPVERVLQELVDAGFSIEEARGALMFITDTAASAGRAVLISRRGGDPSVAELAATLNRVPDTDFPMLREVVVAASQGADEDRLRFELTVIIAGLQQMLIAKTS
ncbi:TetR/AcrR family transcriptional regulator C-terminal domain-containing protein [Nocardia sp. NPDC127606]|uniref:TetR/AcrR family transcriptional regulator C-terminal domain-containing protein n=1 Tax=Nocardia sp. NPDC127606 TaxID=3345406 RepID=UPI003639CFF1